MAALKPSLALTEYFALFNGKNVYADVKATVEALFHPDVVVHTAEGPVDRAGWLQVVDKLFASGVTASLQGVEEQGGDPNTLKYAVRLTYPTGKVVEAASTAVFKDGQYWKHKPADAYVYSEMAAFGQRLNTSGLGAPAKSLVDYFALFNGKNVYADVKATVEALFHPDVVVHTAEGPVDRAGWLQVVDKLFESGVTASLQGVEEQGGDPNTLKYAVRLTYPTGKVVEAASTAVFKDGQYWKHEPADASVYSEMAAFGQSEP